MLTALYTYFLLKDCLDILLPSITKLVNCSLSEGIFSDAFKKVVVTYIVKKTSPLNELNNYPPVSGPCLVLKLVGWVIANNPF